MPSPSSPAQQHSNNAVTAQPEVHSIKASSSTATVDWPTLSKQLSLQGVTAMIAQHCHIRSFENKQMKLVLDSNKATLLTPKIQERLAAQLSEQLNAQIQVHIEIGQEVSQKTPAAIESKHLTQQQAAAKKTLMADADIAAMVQTFDAQITQATFTHTQEDNL